MILTRKFGIQTYLGQIDGISHAQSKYISLFGIILVFNTTKESNHIQ